MSLLKVAEVFGHSVGCSSADASRDRASKRCPFKKGACTKNGRKNPLGICSFTNGERLATVCPVRFLQGEQMFVDVGRLAFGSGVTIAVAPEIRLLNVGMPNGKTKKIGKVDFLIAKLDAGGLPVDFAALEVQSVYISGKGIRPAFNRFLKNGQFASGTDERRMDFRSSAQKRLMPQLNLKVPVFRRWGKKFFVAVDTSFFAAMPAIRNVNSLSNSEVTWLVYPFGVANGSFTPGQPEVKFTLWEDVLGALREGTAPTPEEVLAEIRLKLPKLKLLSL